MKHLSLIVLLILPLISQADIEKNYYGRTLYHQSLDQIVVGYKMGCLSRQSVETPEIFTEGYDCRKFTPDETPILRLEATASQTATPQLLSLKLIPLVANVELHPNEEIIGEDVLYRIVGTIEESTQKECSALKKLNAEYVITCPRENKEDIVLTVLVDTTLQPKQRILEISFKW